MELTLATVTQDDLLTVLLVLLILAAVVWLIKAVSR
jgi:Na+-transporting methylmalonyl-CoA/oxaloacetate decarboxylase gamma subunit